MKLIKSYGLLFLSLTAIFIAVLLNHVSLYTILDNQQTMIINQEKIIATQLETIQSKDK